MFTPNYNLMKEWDIVVVPNCTWQMIRSEKLSRANVQNVLILVITRAENRIRGINAFSDYQCHKCEGDDLDVCHNIVRRGDRIALGYDSD